MTMRALFEGMQIKAKLVLIIVITSVAALLIEAVGFIAYERVRVTDELVRDLSSLARIVADRSSAALLFYDDKVAMETLGALRIKRAVSAACIYDVGGRVFARYERGEDRPFSFPADPKFESRSYTEGGYLHLIEPILVEGTPQGAVFIRASFRELDLLWRDYLLFAALTAFVTSMITLLVATRWQRIVSRPIERLTRTVQMVAISKDYSVRATLDSDDEIGTLVEVFNGMLAAIEDRDTVLLDANRRLSENEAQLKSVNEALEQRVRERTAELQALSDSASVGIVLLKDGLIVRSNRRLDEMFGYAPGEQTGRPLRDRLADTVDEEAEALAAARLAAGDTVRRELMARHKDGSAFWIRLSARVIDRADPARGAVCVIEDITAERDAMDEMIKAKTMAEEASRMKSDFLATMSHEIRTPMNAIIGMLYLALKNEPPAALRNYLAKAQGAAHSLLGIINDILDFSKIEAGKLEIESIEFGLDTVLEQLKDSVGLQAEQKGLEFLIRYDVNIPPALLGDPLRLGQIMLNLCSNAIKFTEQGEVELGFRCVAMTETDLELQFSVRDTGIGIAPDVAERLFQKFTQADQTTTRRFGGTGLGLAISRRLAELMGGRLWIEQSAPGKGTTVCCSIHLQIARDAQTHRRRLVEQAGPLLDGVRVLVVDDNEVSREIMAEMLRFFHLDVSVAGSGAEALERLQVPDAAPVDLVLMDWRMPPMNGDEVTRRIHASPLIRHKPKVVMVTAYGREDVIKSAEQAGVAGFLVKPVSPSTLLDTILSNLGRGRILGKESSRSERGGACDFRGARLLLVEDNDINREFATELLRSMNTEVECAVNGEEAVAMVQRAPYAAVLMDIHMPVMDGLEACRRIRALGQQPGGEHLGELPIIAMTALAMAHDEQRSLAAGMNDHITKPVSPERLRAALSRWLNIPLGEGGAPGPAPSSAPGSDLRALRSLDAEQGIRRIGGDVEAYRKQLRRFRQRYDTAAERLRDLVAHHTPRQAEEYCHALKGVCGNIGADALFACVSDIDNLLKQEIRPDEASLARMAELLATVMADIDSLAAPEQAGAPAGGGLADTDVLARVGRLRGLLESDVGAAQSVLAELLAGIAGSPLEAAVREVAERVDVFEIDEALGLLQALQTQLEGRTGATPP